jgi:hypothetical protein
MLLTMGMAMLVVVDGAVGEMALELTRWSACLNKRMGMSENLNDVLTV